MEKHQKEIIAHCERGLPLSPPCKDLQFFSGKSGKKSQFYSLKIYKKTHPYLM
jgi:hypothetical protein